MDDDHDDNNNDSLDRARADVELLQAAFPDEVEADPTQSTFPLRATFHLEQGESFVVLQYGRGYPISSTLTIASYRSPYKVRMEAVLQSIRENAVVGEEVGLACCMAGLQAWNDFQEEQQQQEAERLESSKQQELAMPPRQHYEWVSGPPLQDRKSTFVAHAVRVYSEQQVREALQQLLASSTKIQRASHNMVAWRVTEMISDEKSVLKHDNDDDGEDASGSRLAQLLHYRKEENVLVVVSRWFGGIHLGPKRFAHITNVARELLVECHETKWTEASS